MAILEMKHISKAFSGVYANEDINLSVEKGEIHALLGENGAGKSNADEYFVWYLYSGYRRNLLEG